MLSGVNFLQTVSIQAHILLFEVLAALKFNPTPADFSLDEAPGFHVVEPDDDISHRRFPPVHWHCLAIKVHRRWLDSG